MQQVQLLSFGEIKNVFFFCNAEPQSISDLLCENPRPTLLHGGSIPGGHEDLDGCHSDGCGGLHAVHELRDRRGTTGLDDGGDGARDQMVAT